MPGTIAHHGVIAAGVVGPWWLAGGILPANALAAYQPKGAASYAASKVNLANPGTNNAAEGIAPPWSAEAGWGFDGTLKYLLTGIVPAITYTHIMRITGANWAATPTPYLFGVYQTATQIFSANVNVPAQTIVFRNGGASAAVAIGTSAVIGLANKTGYLNGIAVATCAAGGTNPTSQIGIGGAYGLLSNANYSFSANVLAISIYNTTLSDPQVLAVSNAMAAL